MKLSPPASSSDIDVARGIAKRLSRLGRGEPREAPLPPFAPLHGRAAEPKAPPPPVERQPEPRRVAPPLVAPSPPEPLRTPRREARPEPRPAPGPPAVPPPAPPRPVPPSAAKAPPAVEAKARALRPAPPAFTDETDDEPLGIISDEDPFNVPEPATAPPTRRPPPEPELELEEDEPPAVEPPELDFDEEPVAEVPRPPADSEPELEMVTDFEEEKPAPPTWSEILQDCLFLARAKGALLIDADGNVTASCGDWPAPGANAISLRLVPAMEKALKGAPTRSVSVPLGAQHLTAWRVPLAFGLVTVGFVAEAPLKPEVRPTIDAELKRGAPA